MWLLVFVLCIYCFPMKNFFLWSAGILFFGASVYCFIRNENLFQKLFLPSLFSIIGINFLLSAHVYPELLTYQSPDAAGRLIKEKNIPAGQFVCFNEGTHSLDFYSQRFVPWIFSPSEIEEKRNSAVLRNDVWVYTNEAGKSAILKFGLLSDSSMLFQHYSVSMLSLPFLNPATRKKELKAKYLLLFRKN